MWLTDVKRYAITLTSDLEMLSKYLYILMEGDDLAARLAYAAGVCIATLLLIAVNSPEHRQEQKQGGEVEGRGMTTHSVLTWSRPPPVMPRHLTVTLYCMYSIQSSTKTDLIILFT